MTEKRPCVDSKREEPRRTPVLIRYQLYHNYIRPHEALDGKTPADACGIDIQGQDKWKTLITKRK